MKTRHLLLSFALGLGLALALLWTLNSRRVPVTAAPAAELQVCPSGCAYSSVQAAVDAASDGDVVKVAEGTYTDISVRPRNDITTTGVVTQVVYVSKTVTIQGGYTTTNWTTPDPEANPTTLDALGQGRVFYVTGDISPTIEGLRITSGDAAGLGGWLAPFSGDADTDAGGGVYVITASATIEDNRVFSNTTAHVGGGVALIESDATFSDNAVTSNTAGGGGGLFLCESDGTLSGNTISGNTAGGSGGLELWASPATLDGNTITANTATGGCGGVRLFISAATLRGNVITANTAEHEGGGLCLMASDDTLINNVIADNQAGTVGSGAHIESSSPRLSHNTIARNSGGDGSGIYIAEYAPGDTSCVTVTNTILVSQGVGIEVTGGSTVTVNGILWHSTPITISQSPTATVSVQNQITGDPAFVDPDGGDYHIGAGSAAHDAGVDSEVTTDIDGQVRPMGWGYDLGADEYPGAHLDIVKRASAAILNPGQTLTYTIVVTSTGEENATGVVLTDTLDGWQRPITATSSVGGCAIPDAGWGGSAVCTPGTLVTGTTAVVTLTAEVSTTVTVGQAMVNTVVVVANETTDSAQDTTYGQDCHVRINGSPTEYSTIQAAVDAASPDDLVKVAGTCIGSSTRAGLRQQVYVDKSITIQGGYTTSNWTAPDPEANPTTLDAQGQGRVLYITGDVSPTIEGLRITGGDAAGLGGTPWGDAGGGIYVITATAVISNNWVSSNNADWGGGVFLFMDDATLSGNTIISNTAELGGGLHVRESAATLSDNTITANAADYGGGGLMVNRSNTVALSGNVVTSNTAVIYGGGLWVATSDATLTNNVVADNQVSGEGSGLAVVASSLRLLHTTIARNSGGDGSGIYVTEAWWDGTPSTVALTNTILADHSVGITVTGGNTVTVNGILWHNVYINVSQSPTATVNLQNQHWGDAAFVNPDGGDYHIFEGSAAIDQGVDAGITVDIDGESRPIGAGYDLGADEYPCDAVSNVQLSRTPPGDLFTGNTVHFTADADGTKPFTYTWALDGAPVGENRSTFEYTFAVSDTYTVGVTVTNGCGQGSDTMVVMVDDPAPQQPDLSQSHKWVNLTSVEGGDVLTYTLVLRNSSDVTATVTLTDAIPAYTAYVSGSAQASISPTVTVAGGQLHWSGQVITGTPVVIQFAVEVTTTALSVGTRITNVAYLDDGLGNVTALEVESTYNPGYGLTINDDVLYTDVPTVTLRYSWNVADDILYVKFSNDGGFGPGGGTSAWIPVNPADPTYPDWVLDAYGNLVLPRTVYAKFRDGSGLQYGPIQDDIIYDPVEPQVTGVEIITQTSGGALSAMAGQDVIVRVTTNDDNSGVSKVQLSHSADFAQYSEFAVTGGTTDISWTLQPSGQVYVRVVDRAGNLSEVESEQGPPNYEVYLPLVLRLYVTP